MAYHGSFIDFHVHLYPEKLYAAILKWFYANSQWRFPYTKPWEEAATLLSGMELLERFVCFGYAHKPGIAGELNAFYAAVAARFPKAVALMCAHQDDPNLARLADDAFAAGLKGVKLHCQVQRISPADRRFDPLWERVIANRGFALLHSGNGPFPGEGVGFANFAPLMERFPELVCVVAHLGCNEGELFLREALRRDNLYLDTSYTFIDNPTRRMDAPLSLVREASEKLLYGSDFPGICHSYEAGFEAIANLGLSETELTRIFHSNARNLFARLST